MSPGPGTVKAVAHTSDAPVAAFPDLPPVADALPGFRALEWNGLFLPARTPASIVERLNGALNDAIFIRLLIDEDGVHGADLREPFLEVVEAAQAFRGDATAPGHTRGIGTPRSRPNGAGRRSGYEHSYQPWGQGPSRLE